MCEDVQFGFDLGETLFAVVDQVDLVDGRDQVGHPEQRGDPGMATGLTNHARAGVHQQHRHVRVGRTGEHVAGVRLVTGGVGEDEIACGRGEEAVGHVDGDALLAFGPQTVGQGGEVGNTFGVGDRFEVIERQTVGVVEQPTDQCALTVVHRTGGGEPEQLACHLKVPLPFAVFHGRGGRAVVCAGLAALGHGGCGDLGDHVGDRGGP